MMPPFDDATIARLRALQPLLDQHPHIAPYLLDIIDDVAEPILMALSHTSDPDMWQQRIGDLADRLYDWNRKIRGL